MLNVGQILGIVAGSLAGVIILGETGCGVYLGFDDSKEKRAKGEIGNQTISNRCSDFWKKGWEEHPLLTVSLAPLLAGGNLGMIAEHYLAKQPTPLDQKIDIDPSILNSN